MQALNEDELLEKLREAGFICSQQGTYRTFMRRSGRAYVDYMVIERQHVRASRVRKFIPPYMGEPDPGRDKNGAPRDVYQEVLTWPHESQ